MSKEDTLTPLHEAIEKIDAQLEELRPAAEEYLRLGEIRKSLESLLDNENANGEIVIDEPTLRHATSHNGKSGVTRVTHRHLPSGDELEYVRRGPVTRAILAYIQNHPGITVRRVAEECGTSTPYAYDVVRNLIANDQIVRQDGQVYPAKHVSVRKTKKVA